MVFVVLLSAAWARSRGIPGMAPSIVVKWRQDDKFYYLESTGMPMHKIMDGITAWGYKYRLHFKKPGAQSFEQSPIARRE
jgi:hypothetical protein